MMFEYQYSSALAKHILQRILATDEIPENGIDSSHFTTDEFPNKELINWHLGKLSEEGYIHTEERMYITGLYYSAFAVMPDGERLLEHLVGE